MPFSMPAVSIVAVVFLNLTAGASAEQLRVPLSSRLPGPACTLFSQLGSTASLIYAEPPEHTTDRARSGVVSGVCGISDIVSYMTPGKYSCFWSALNALRPILQISRKPLFCRPMRREHPNVDAYQ